MSALTVIDVAKKSSPRGKPAPAEETGRKPLIVQVRGTDEYKTWAEDLAKFDNRSLSSLVERALRRYAIEIGFKREAPER